MIPFTAEAYTGLLAQYAAATWPAQLAAAILGLVALRLALKPSSRSRVVVALLLTAAWLWTAVVFHGLYLVSLVWAAWAFGALFALQGALFAVAGLRGALSFGPGPGTDDRGPVSRAGLCLAVISVGLFPLSAVLAWAGMTVLPLAPLLSPAPLVLFSTALLLLAVPRAPRHLLIIPAIWSAAAAFVTWELAIPQGLLLSLAALLCLALSLRRPR